MRLVSSKTAYELARLPIKQQRLSIGSTRAEELSIGRVADNVYKAVVILKQWDREQREEGRECGRRKGKRLLGKKEERWGFIKWGDYKPPN